MDMSETRHMAAVLRGEMRELEPMSRHVSWRAGGQARLAYLPVDVDDLAAFLRSLPAEEPVLMVGLGSNLLVRDGGYDGTVVFTHRALGDLQVVPGDADATAVTAQAGVPCPKLARRTAMHDLAGAEFMAGIPGTVGGALAMNAGCYGGETWGIVSQVQTVNRHGELRVRQSADYVIGYRHVALREHSALAPVAQDEWFVAATFVLNRGDGSASRAVIKDLLARRIAAQPLGEPNAGSVFRNPPGDHAARLVEACGLKGKARGGAEISQKHANFIVNRGGASAADIEYLIRLARETVERRFALTLETEVRIVGAPL